MEGYTLLLGEGMGNFPGVDSIGATRVKTDCRTPSPRELRHACRDRVDCHNALTGFVDGTGSRGRRSSGGGIDRIDTDGRADKNGASAALATPADGNS
jgi:hypothetical protein